LNWPKDLAFDNEGNLYVVESDNHRVQMIEFVKIYKYLGVNISVKLGWENYINERLRRISRIYQAMRIIFRTINKKEIKIRRKIFLSNALPHYLWLFCTWFLFTERQRERIMHMYCTGLRIMHNLHAWDDYTTLILTKEKSLYDYLFSYWRKLIHHLLSAEEALAYQMTWSTYLIITSEEKSLWKDSGYRKNSRFFCRLRRQVKHSLIDWLEFDNLHARQYECFVSSDGVINRFIYKYFLQSLELS
jgi:hypothetical protein